MKNYSQYSEDDFIMDPDFQIWVKNPSPGSELFWNTFLQEHPHKKTEIDAAKALLSSMVFKKNLLPSEKEAIWQEVDAAIQKQKEARLVFMKNDRIFSVKRLLYASVAVLTGFTVFLSVYYFTGKTAQRVATKYGEIKKIILPDSSFVMLNGHSTIKYNHEWNIANEREVWIEGEAFFSVKHTPDIQRFIVHTNHLDIEVLGTEFNVKQRDDKLKVSLNSGKIKLKINESADIVLMMPGDILEIDSKRVQKKLGNVDDLSGWKENKLVFDDTPLSEIIVQLKYIYGWEFAKVEENILKEKLTGEVETKDEQKLINTLERALRIKIVKEGKTVYISRL